MNINRCFISKGNKIFFYVMVFLLSSCRVFQPSIMLKTPKGYHFAEFADSIKTDYKIQANDIVNFNLFSNDGFKLIDVIRDEQDGNSSLNNNPINYTVESDGFVKLPVLGRIKLDGLTVKDAENMLEEKYSEFYKNPFILIKVTNKRVIVFPGAEGVASVIPLNNQNTTLMEAIALAGGISSVGKAFRVKLIRGDLKNNPQVYLFDLSKIKEIDKAGIMLQANDIIYIEPTFSPAKEVVAELTPVLSILSLTTSLILVFRLINNQ